MLMMRTMDVCALCRLVVIFGFAFLGWDGFEIRLWGRPKKDIKESLCRFLFCFIVAEVISSRFSFSCSPEPTSERSHLNKFSPEEERKSAMRGQFSLLFTFFFRAEIESPNGSHYSSSCWLSSVCLCEHLGKGLDLGERVVSDCPSGCASVRIIR